MSRIADAWTALIRARRVRIIGAGVTGLIGMVVLASIGAWGLALLVLIAFVAMTGLYVWDSRRSGS